MSAIYSSYLQKPFSSEERTEISNFSCWINYLLSIHLHRHSDKKIDLTIHCTAIGRYTALSVDDGTMRHLQDRMVSIFISIFSYFLNKETVKDEFLSSYEFFVDFLWFAEPKIRRRHCFPRPVLSSDWREPRASVAAPPRLAPLPVSEPQSGWVSGERRVARRRTSPARQRTRVSGQECACWASLSSGWNWPCPGCRQTRSWASSTRCASPWPTSTTYTACWCRRSSPRAVSRTGRSSRLLGIR